MKRFDELTDRMPLAAGRQSGRIASLLVVALYGGIGLALPLGLGWSVNWLVGANVLGSSLAGVVVFMWLAVRIQAQHRRHLVEWTSDLRRLDAGEFEWFVGEVFRRQGWNVEETGRQGAPDGNVDLRLTKGRDRAVVQCKRWTANLVGVDQIRAFAGTLLREGLAGPSGIFVTLSDFTESAREEAKTLGIMLVDHRDLFERVEKVRTPNPCPTCKRPMLLDRSVHGWWFRCVASGCDGKQNLGREPARALELLTESPDPTV